MLLDKFLLNRSCCPCSAASEAGPGVRAARRRGRHPPGGAAGHHSLPTLPAGARGLAQERQGRPKRLRRTQGRTAAFARQGPAHAAGKRRRCCRYAAHLRSQLFDIPSCEWGRAVCLRTFLNCFAAANGLSLVHCAACDFQVYAFFLSRAHNLQLALNLDTAATLSSSVMTTANKSLSTGCQLCLPHEA